MQEGGWHLSLITWQSDRRGGALTRPRCDHTRCWGCWGWGSSPGDRRRWRRPGRSCSGSGGAGDGWPPPGADTWPTHTGARGPSSNCLEWWRHIMMRGAVACVTVIPTLNVIVPIEDGACGTVQVGHCPNMWAACVLPDMGWWSLEMSGIMFTWRWCPEGDRWGWSRSHWGWRRGRAGTRRWRCLSPPAWRR